MYHAVIWVMLFWMQSTVPYKPSDEFQVVIEYKFKPKPAASNTTLDYSETRLEHEKRNRADGPLPYLIVNLKVLKLGEGEVRLRGSDNKGNTILTKKLVAGESYPIDMGYTDDIKDRVSAHEFEIFFLSDRKKELTRVVLTVDEDGTFFVNGEKRGKF